MRPIVDIKSDRFTIFDDVLGTGAFSVVKLACPKESNTAIAVKICHCHTDKEWLQSLNEICLLKEFNHKNITKLIDYEITRFHALIGLDKGEASLKDYISSHDSSSRRAHAISILSQIMNALNYMHSHRIIHGDVKPSNIIYVLRNETINIQIMDLGLSHVVPRKDSETLIDAGGTQVYLAPERLLHCKYDATSDIFSAGIVFFEILFRRHPFYKDGDNYEEFMKTRPPPKFPQAYQVKVTRTSLDILSIMLSYSPQNRDAVRNHPELNTKYVAYSADYQRRAHLNVATGDEAERLGNFSAAAIHYMDASINLGILLYESNLGFRFRRDMYSRIDRYRQKVIDLLYQFKHSYAAFRSRGGRRVYDEYYEYLMDVTTSTPKLKHYVDLGYHGELYFCENRQELAFQNFMEALGTLNKMITAEPPGDRKTLIGKKMSQWTNMAETIKKSVK